MVLSQLYFQVIEHHITIGVAAYLADPYGLPAMVLSQYLQVTITATFAITAEVSSGLDSLVLGEAQILAQARER